MYSSKMLRDISLRILLTFFILNLAEHVMESRPHGHHNESSFLAARSLFAPNQTKYQVVSGNQFLDTSDIIFPDSYEELVNIESKIEIGKAPKCPKGQVFCEIGDAYPYQQLKQILKKAPIDKTFFGADEVDLSIRIGDPEENFFCTSIEQVIYPTVGVNKNKKWKFIVNDKEDARYLQGVRVELCSKPDGPCELVGNIPPGFIVKCKQKYLYRRLLSLTEEGKTTPDSFQVPSACCCSYKKDPAFLTNFGKS